MVSRLLGREGSRCWASTIGAGKSLGKVLTRIERASTPPADEPTTTRTFSRASVLSDVIVEISFCASLILLRLLLGYNTG
jgi:hypothetical protein